MDCTYNKKLNNISFSKTCLMLCIVAYHSMALYTGEWFNQAPAIESNFFYYLSYFLQSFHIYAFTLISGYLFYYLKEEQNKYQNIKKFVLNKFKRLIVPYISIAILWNIPFNIYFYKGQLSSIVKKYVLGISPNQLWFLLMLFWVFIIAELFWKHLTEKTLLGLTIVGLFWVIGHVSAVIPNLYQIFTGFQYLLFFWIGMMLRKYGISNLEKIPSVVYIFIHIALFVINYIISTIYGNILIKVLHIVLATMLHIFGAISVFVVLNKIAKRKIKFNLIYNVLNKHSFTIYLFHQQIMYCVITLFNGKVQPVILVILNFTIALSISLLISYVLHLNKYTRVIIGER